MCSIPAILLALFSLPLAAFCDPPPPARGLKIIDFEERKLGNNEDLPMHWVKISGPGLPHYVNGYLSNDVLMAANTAFGLISTVARWSIATIRPKSRSWPGRNIMSSVIARPR